MLPSEDAIWVGEELAAGSGYRRQLAMSATDANRFVLRFARHLTGRPRIAVMDWCYHGTVDETLAVLEGDRVVPPRVRSAPRCRRGRRPPSCRSTTPRPSTAGWARVMSPAC